MSETYLPVVTGVAVIGDHVLRLLFRDGTVGDVDFSAEHWTGVLEPLNDTAYFGQVAVDAEAGTVTWPGRTAPHGRVTPIPGSLASRCPRRKCGLQVSTMCPDAGEQMAFEELFLAPVVDGLLVHLIGQALTGIEPQARKDPVCKALEIAVGRAIRRYATSNGNADLARPLLQRCSFLSRPEVVAQFAARRPRNRVVAA